MTIPMLVMSLLFTLALLLSIAALAVALRTSDRSLLRRFIALSERFTEIESALESLQGRQRSFAARISTLSRSNAPNGAAPDATAPMTEAQKDEWQRSMNREIALRRTR